MNTNAKHTPGPWQFSPGHDPHNQAQIYGDDGKTLAVTFSDEGSANARLIAAAPDLLFALYACLAELVDVVNAEGGDESEAMRQARAAILQAEGGAQ